MAYLRLHVVLDIALDWHRSRVVGGDDLHVGQLLELARPHFLGVNFHASEASPFELVGVGEPVVALMEHKVLRRMKSTCRG